MILGGEWKLTSLAYVTRYCDVLNIRMQEWKEGAGRAAPSPVGCEAVCSCDATGHSWAPCHIPPEEPAGWQHDAVSHIYLPFSVCEYKWWGT